MHIHTYIYIIYLRCTLKKSLYWHFDRNLILRSEYISYCLKIFLIDPSPFSQLKNTYDYISSVQEQSKKHRASYPLFVEVHQISKDKEKNIRKRRAGLQKGDEEAQLLRFPYELIYFSFTPFAHRKHGSYLRTN